MNTKAILVDGHNFLFRGYNGVPEAAKMADGTQINAVYGFFSLLRNTLKTIDPDYLMVMFDSETSIDQKKEVRPEYKSNRPVNDSVYSQLPLIKKCLDILKIKWIENPDFEADDLIGTYAEIFNQQGAKSFIASTDCDFIQLVSEKIYIVKGRHGSVDIYNTSKVHSVFGIYPEQYLDYLAIVGDSSDNIKGIKGIGKKRAVELLSKYKDIRGIYEASDLLPLKLKNLLLNREESLLMQKEFLKINRNLNLDMNFLMEAYAYRHERLPEKMGKFLDQHWGNLVYKEKICLR